jgi:hypothetical protein
MVTLDPPEVEALGGSMLLIDTLDLHVNSNESETRFPEESAR